MMILKQLLILFLFNFSTGQAQNYTPVDADSKVHFVIKNFGIETEGSFTGLQGGISFSTSQPETSSFDVTVSSATINTDNSSRDSQLKGDEYFNVTKFPVIRITSTKIARTNKTDEGFYYFTGNLIMNGVTGTISFPFQAIKTNGSYVFTGKFEINRLDYGIGEESIVLSNKVVISLKVSTKKK